MIVGSIVLLVVAAALLVVGLVRRSDDLYYGSIVGSVLAALALVVGVRQMSVAADDDDFDVRPSAPKLADAAESRAALPAPLGSGVPPRAVGHAVAAQTDPDESFLPDEPPAQPVAEADAARVALLDTEVLVIDGRPRYHVAECLHLLGREHQWLPVCEAVELGFTPCGHCEPDRVLLAGPSRSR